MDRYAFVGELAGIRRDHLSIDSQGVVIALARTKTATHTEHVPVAAHPSSRWDPVDHLQLWLSALDDTAVEPDCDTVWARVTRTTAGGTIPQPPKPIADDAINDVVKRRTRMAGLANASTYSAHSLRSGFITEAKNRRIDEADIMGHTRHKSLTVMRSYDRT